MVLFSSNAYEKLNIQHWWRVLHLTDLQSDQWEGHENQALIDNSQIMDNKGLKPKNI